MKRVYCVFETSHDNAVYNEYGWSYAVYNYEDRFIDVYDNYQAAVLSIKYWADHHSDIVERRSGDHYESIDIKETWLISPDFKYNVTMRREIKSVLLKSS